MEDKLDVKVLLEELEALVAEGTVLPGVALSIKAQLAVANALNNNSQQLERINFNVKELKIRRAPVGPQ